MDNSIENDEEWMQAAILAARQAALEGEVPVGAVLVKDDSLIIAAGNSPIGMNDPTAHAEIIAIRGAAKRHANYRLPGTTLFVTLEPCIMCMGAIIHARIERLVYGATDPKSGAVSSVYNIGSDGLLNHNLEISSGILQDQCALLLKTFFIQRRATLKLAKNALI